MLMKSRIYQILIAVMAIFCVQDIFAQAAMEENKQRPIDDAIIGGAMIRANVGTAAIDEIITDFENTDEDDAEGGVVELDELTVNNFDIYPNPANRVVTLILNKRDDYKIKVYDLSGRLVHAEFHDAVNSVSMDIGDFPPSLYLVHIEGSTVNETKKLRVSR